jgi:hypothetical protein
MVMTRAGCYFASAVAVLVAPADVLPAVSTAHTR